MTTTKDLSKSDQYGTGWTQGRTDALRELRAMVIRMMPSTTINLPNGPHMHVNEVLALIDAARAEHDPAARTRAS